MAQGIVHSERAETLDIGFNVPDLIRETQAAQREPIRAPPCLQSHARSAIIVPAKTVPQASPPAAETAYPAKLLDY